MQRCWRVARRTVRRRVVPGERPDGVLIRHSASHRLGPGREVAARPSAETFSPSHPWGDAMAQQIHYCTTPDGVRIAYSSIGTGLPIVRAAHWMTHLEYDLESPVWRHLIGGLAERHLVLRYDCRGTGMSDRQVPDISFERYVTDLECVVDAANLDRFALLGISQGAPISVAYAVRHPERVSHLILFGGFARGALRQDDVQRGEEWLEFSRALVRAGWGREQPAYRQWFTSQFIPDSTVEQARWFNHLEQISASADVAERILVANSEIDITALLPQVRVPTLVIHSRGDQICRFSAGQELAGLIPGATFVPLESGNHVFLPHEPAHRAFFEAVAPFLGDPRPRGRLPGMERTERLRSTVLGIEASLPFRLIAILAALAGIVGLVATLL